MYRSLLLAIVIGSFAVLTACNPAQPANPNAKIQVVATTGMLADLAINLCGDKCEVQSLMGPGVDPHLYKPTADDLQKIQSADIVLHGGLHLEGRMSEILESLGNKSFQSSDSIDPTQILTHSGQPDPHIWHNPVHWLKVATKFSGKLSEYRKADREYFRDQFDTYSKKLIDLDQEVQTTLATIPEEQRILVTAHDAFEYFGQQYKFQVLGIQGTNTVTEASAQNIVKLADTIANKKIKAIFVESSVNPATIQALQKAVQNRNWEVKIGGELYSDALGASGTPEGTYIGMIKHNVTTIANALK